MLGILLFCKPTVHGERTPENLHSQAKGVDLMSLVLLRDLVFVVCLRLLINNLSGATRDACSENFF